MRRLLSRSAFCLIPGEPRWPGDCERSPTPYDWWYTLIGWNVPVVGTAKLEIGEGG